MLAINAAHIRLKHVCLEQSWLQEGYFDTVLLYDICWGLAYFYCHLQTPLEENFYWASDIIKTLPRSQNV